MTTRLALGIDLGGSHVAVAAVAEDGHIHQNASTDIDDHAPDKVVSAIVKTAKVVLEKARGEVVGIGIGSPGNIDPSTGVIRYSPNFGWQNVALGEMLKAKLDLPVYIANDARCATLGEHAFGVGRGTKDFVLLTLGTGIGGGIIAQGQMLLGNGMAAGEVGHHQIRAHDGFICGCEKRGCFEAQASGTGLIRHAIALAPSFPKSLLTAGKVDELGSKAIRRGAEDGQGHALAAWRAWIDDLALGLANIVAIINPEKIALGGGVSSSGEFLRAAVAPKVAALTTMAPANSSEIVIAELGNDAGPIGAATMAFQGGLRPSSTAPSAVAV
jgi:glucokinase